ncbi:UvrB/uvrC motif [Seminavis robusta]|uniref:UvrB/uvrC motif n=1 Tax=Seminavis robusta TaxID=568900 RepID=A0A9N8DXF9_9STRA|nr:UvrB/uvrC motif [Seminavis robusta]|eukprot:Sro442_g143950.1 UvrB/uvrC motif (504) ;mRNA; f:55048-56958
MPKRQMSNLSTVPCCVLLLALSSWPCLPTSMAWAPSPTHCHSTRRQQLSSGGSTTSILTLAVNKNLEDDSGAPDHSPQQQQPAQSSSHQQHDDNNNNSMDEQDRERNMTRNVMKKIRVAKAQAEIDRILQGPDAPVDTEAEMEKVISMNHIASEQPLVEDQMAQLESELYDAVKQQDFTMASFKQAQLSQLQQQDAFDDGGAILQVNAAFYKAFSKKSWKDMERVWLDGDTSICIHPSHRPLVGARRIQKSWKQMFASTDGSFQRNWMEPHQIRVLQKGSHMAIVTCEEHVFCRRFVRGKKRQTELINKLLATNIFRKVQDKWYMCYHHASWHPDSDAAKRALTGNTGDATTSKIVGDRWNDDYDPSSRQRRRRRQLEDDQDENEDIGMEGILGNEFGPVLGDDGEEEKPTKRIIMGASLSDILNGGLGDLLGNDSKGGRNNAAGNDSMVEVAYELLCGDSKDDDAEASDDTAEEEFADQCRVFAQDHLQREESELLDRGSAI